MHPQVSSDPGSPQTSSFARLSLNQVLTWCAFLFPWVMLTAYLHIFWSYSPQYEYGWLVLPLAARLFYLRWNSLAELPASPKHGSLFIAAACALLIAPMWLIRQTTTHWGIPGYGLTALVTAYTLAMLAALGGWKLARQMLIAVIFIFCAVKLPLTPEQAIIQTLSRFVTHAAVEILYLIGIPAAASGNLVILSNGVIGINEACSGINSLQSLFMVALFFGEERRMLITRRLFMIGLGVFLSLSFNTLRIFILSMVCLYNGTTDFEMWHDRAGWSILVISLIIMMAVARHIGDPPSELKGPPRCLKPFPSFLSGGFAIWFLLVAAGAETWFAMHDNQIANRRHIAIRWPQEKPNFTPVEIPDRVRDITLCSNGRSGRWQETDNTDWNLSLLEFGGGPKGTSQWAPMHTPDICYPAAGMRLVRDLPPETLDVTGGKLIFRAWEFKRQTQSVYVFYSLNNESNLDVTAPFVQDMFGWDRVVQGQRNLGQQTVEFALSGYNSYQDALYALKIRLPKTVSLEK